MSRLNAGDSPSFDSLQAAVVALQNGNGGSLPVSATTLGAVGDGKIVADGAITTGTATLTSATGSFTSADVGKTISVLGAGAAGVALVTTVLAYVSATQLTLTANAATTVTGAEVVWGTNSTAGILAAFATVGTVVFPGGTGTYLCLDNPVSTGATNIIGIGNVTIQLVSPATVGPCFDHSAGYPLTGASMENILVRGDGGVLGTGSMIGVRLKNAIRVKLSHVRISSLSVGLDLYNDAGGFCERNDIDEACHINNCATGLRFYRTATGNASYSYNRFDNLGIDDCRIGVDVGGVAPAVPNLNASCFTSVEVWLQRNSDIGIVLNGDMNSVTWQGVVERLGGTSTVGVDVRASAANISTANWLIRFLSNGTNIATSTVQFPYTQGTGRYVQTATGVTAIFQEHYGDGDTQPSVRVSRPSGGRGRLSLGPGGSTAVDTFIYSSAVNEVTTDGLMKAVSGFTSAGVFTANDDGSSISKVVAQFGKADTTGRWDIQSGGSPTTRRILRGYSGTTETITLDPNNGLQVANVVKSGIAALTYSASITPVYSTEWQTLTVTNGTAFTINAPTSPPDGTHSGELTIEILNSSGGAMGAITWNAVFVFTGLVWTNPATTKKRRVTFRWNGSAWIATSIATTDY